MDEHLADLPAFLGGHIRISVAALIVGVGFSVPLGIAASRAPWLERPVLGVARVVQTIPGLAMLAAMVPLLAALGLPSIGVLPAFLGLVAYSALPVLQNTVVGLRGIDPTLIEAADALGLTDGQRLRRVELPLAMPVILGGVRTATVWTVGAATLSTPVGATSLGNYIFAGLQTRDHASVLIGCVAAAALALGLDAAIARLSVVAERRPAGAAGVVAVALVAVGVTGLAPMWTSDGTAPVVIGAKTFTEQYVLAEVLRDTLAAAGVASEVRSSLGSTVAFDALVAGDIDTYVDYSGTLWATIVHEEPPPDRAAALDALRVALDERYGVGLVAALGFENAYVLAMRRERADALGVRTIGDLTLVAPTLSVGGDYEFFGRPEWASVRSVYGLTFREQRQMDPSLLYEAARNGDVDVISAYSTDGRIGSYDLAVLTDDRGAIPAYDAVVLVRPGLDRDRPEVVGALAALAGTIDAPLMRSLNWGVDEGGESPAQAARHVGEPR